MKITLKIKNQVMTAEADGPIVAGSVGVVTCAAEFDDSWVKDSIRIVFDGSGIQKAVDWTGTKFLVPWEVLRHPGNLRIAAIGKGDGRFRPTARLWYPLKIIRAGASDAKPGVEDTGGISSGGISSGGSTNTVQPETFGAVGDGKHDDGPALQRALESGKPVVLDKDLYVKSNVLVADHDVDFDGCGHTIYLQHAGILVKSTPWAPGENGGKIGACSMVTETAAAPGDDRASPYHRGYLTYHGRKTLQEEYEESSTLYWDIHQANIRNLVLQCENLEGENQHDLEALSLYYLCNSKIDNVKVYLQYGDNGAVGIGVYFGQNVRVENCHAEGFAMPKNGMVDVRGYGFQIVGDNICLSHCSGEQCKHVVCTSGPRRMWSTNITIDHCNFRTDFRKIQHPNGACHFMQQLDVHGDAVNVTITGCNFYWWALDGNTQSNAIMTIRADQVRISNCNAYTNGSWICFGEYANTIYIDGFYGPEVHLTTDFRQSGDHNKLHFMRELHVVNSEFSRLRSCTGPTKIYLTGCTINGFVIDVQYLIARDCFFRREKPWASQPTMVLQGESILSHCIIYGHREPSIGKKAVIIQAPEHSVHMDFCKLYKRQGEYSIFDTEQDQGVGNWVEDVFALYLDTQDVLDQNTLL